MKVSSVLEVLFDSEKSAQDAYKTLKSEESSSERVGSSLELKGKKLLVSVEAKDPVAMRAVLNSYLRYLSLIKKL
ncbi:hypothetical protein JXB01_00240 [Candidatus Micrarchaeota archaeon]|nr:hypothetical protein [Candidatus Micrarchaeota archaeon]